MLFRLKLKKYDVELYELIVGTPTNIKQDLRPARLRIFVIV